MGGWPILPAGQLDKTTEKFLRHFSGGRYDCTPNYGIKHVAKRLWQFTQAIGSFLNAGRHFHPPSLKTTNGDVSKYVKDLEGEFVWSLIRINNDRDHINTQDIGIHILRISSQHEGFVLSSPAIHQPPGVTNFFSEFTG